MTSLRAFLQDHRRLAVVMIALALAMKVLVPAGYMVGGHGKVLTVLICADTQGGQITKQITRQIVVQTAGESGDHDKAGKSGGACAFTALGFAALSGADVVLLAAALAFVLARGYAPVNRPRLARVFNILPPLRGPPAFA